MTQNRKRGRNMQEDEVEFMPLSKRINNLHINGTLLIDTPNRNFYEQSSEWGPGPPLYPHDSIISYNAPDTPPEPTNHPNFPMETTEYQPSMDEVANPHYYFKNKLLFQVHMERLQRLGHQF